MKRILLITAAILLISCSGDDNNIETDSIFSIAGTWKVIESTVNGHTGDTSDCEQALNDPDNPAYHGVYWTYIFNEDGTYEQRHTCEYPQQPAFHGSYELNGDMLKLDEGNDEVIDGHFQLSIISDNVIGADCTSCSEGFYLVLEKHP